MLLLALSEAAESAGGTDLVDFLAEIGVAVAIVREPDEHIRRMRLFRDLAARGYDVATVDVYASADGDMETVGPPYLAARSMLAPGLPRPTEYPST